MRNHLLGMLLVLASMALGAYAQEKKVYSASERKTEEVRIQKEIADYLDWHNLAPDQLDGIADWERRLFSATNQSLLLSKKTRLRFGIFESFNDQNQKIFEIRFHTRNKLNNRFEIDSANNCVKSPFAEVVKQIDSGVLLRFGCKQGVYPNHLQELYFFHYQSQDLYFLLTSFGVQQESPATLVEKGYNYKIRWKLKAGGVVGDGKFSTSFNISKKDGKWVVVTNDAPTAYDKVTARSKLPLDPKYNLPDVMNWDE